MRGLTAEEERMLDRIPQDLFLAYAASRLAENKKPKRKCGHWKEYYPYCKTCQRSEVLTTKTAEQLAKQFSKEPAEMRALLKRTHREYERSGDDSMDFPIYLVQKLGVDRKRAVQLIRVFGVSV